MFRSSSPGGGTSWTSDNYSGWLSSSPAAKSALYDWLVIVI